MSSGTLIAPPASETLTAAPEELPISGTVDRRGEYRCECGHELRVFGGGRHRVYFEPADARREDPVMNRVCPACERGLPGKNRP
jgi:hypothetical protein